MYKEVLLILECLSKCMLVQIGNYPIIYYDTCHTVEYMINKDYYS